MTMLVDFLCRFGFGMALGLVLTPSALVPPGFFRVNLLVVMGLGTFAALLAHGAVSGGVWILPAAAAVVAWMGTVLWLAHRIRAGGVACGVAGLLLALAVVLLAGGVPDGTTEIGRPGTRLPTVAGHLLSGAIVGLTVHAMLLGHWYLNAPGMRVDALRRMIDVALIAWFPRLLLSSAAVGGAWFLADPGAAAPAVHSATASSLLALRWLAGLIGLPVLLWMSRKTLDVPNTQSATGILYVACLAAIVGELAAQLLAAG